MLLTIDDDVAQLSPARLQALHSLQPQAEQDDHKLPQPTTRCVISHMCTKGYCSELHKLHEKISQTCRVDILFNAQAYFMHLHHKRICR